MVLGSLAVTGTGIMLALSQIQIPAPLPDLNSLGGFTLDFELTSLIFH
jgi:hypothetical protein